MTITSENVKGSYADRGKMVQMEIWFFTKERGLSEMANVHKYL